MKSITVLDEPLLEFYKGEHIDIRYGLTHFGPFDRDGEDSRKIRIGIIGSEETNQNINKWLSKLELPIESSEENERLHPTFPGLNSKSNLNLELETNDKFIDVLNPTSLSKAIKIDSHDESATEIVKLFEETIESLLAKTSIDIILCCPPIEVFKKLRIDTPKENKSSKISIDFHDLLKSKALKFNVPIQFIWPWSYTEGLKPPKGTSLSLQSDSEIAWNFYLALYYKSAGIPWRMTRDSKESATCYVGISFYHNIKKTKVLSSIAQVFNEKGEGIIMRGEPVKVNKTDKSINLSEENAYQLLDNALKTYKKEHYNFPGRVVLHKSSSFNESEITGFKKALEKYFIEFFDFVSIRRSLTRVFRESYYPPLRGIFSMLDNENAILYTRGSINFYQEYPGMYVPRALSLNFPEIQSSPSKLAKEILELSKMNYNNSQFSELLPITLRTSRSVSTIIKYVDKDNYLPPSYRFYM